MADYRVTDSVSGRVSDRVSDSDINDRNVNRYDKVIMMEINQDVCDSDRDSSSGNNGSTVVQSSSGITNNVIDNNFIVDNLISSSGNSSSNSNSDSDSSRFGNSSSSSSGNSGRNMDKDTHGLMVYVISVAKWPPHSRLLSCIDHWLSRCIGSGIGLGLELRNELTGQYNTGYIDRSSDRGDRGNGRDDEDRGCLGLPLLQSEAVDLSLSTDTVQTGLFRSSANNGSFRGGSSGGSSTSSSNSSSDINYSISSNVNDNSKTVCGLCGLHQAKGVRSAGQRAPGLSLDQLKELKSRMRVSDVSVNEHIYNLIERWGFPNQETNDNLKVKITNQNNDDNSDKNCDDSDDADGYRLKRVESSVNGIYTCSCSGIKDFMSSSDWGGVGFTGVLSSYTALKYLTLSVSVDDSIEGKNHCHIDYSYHLYYYVIFHIIVMSIIAFIFISLLLSLLLSIIAVATLLLSLSFK
jgi:hypothetical protein